MFLHSKTRAKDKDDLSPCPFRLKAGLQTCDHFNKIPAKLAVM